MTESSHNYVMVNGVKHVRLDNGDTLAADVFFRIQKAAEIKGRESAGDIREIEVVYQNEDHTLMLGDKNAVKALFARMDREITKLKTGKASSEEITLRRLIRKLRRENEALGETNKEVQSKLDATRETFKEWKDRVSNQMTVARNSIAALERRALNAEGKLANSAPAAQSFSATGNAQAYEIAADYIRDYAFQNRMKIDDRFYESMRSGKIPPEAIADFLNSKNSRTRRGQMWTKMSVMGAMTYLINQLRKGGGRRAVQHKERAA